MSRGGTLTIETRRIEFNIEEASAHVLPHAGAYAVLMVADTGVGMSAEIQARAFEPFFTTKGHGSGTGLGLATVHGIVKQSGGSILVYSEVGVGTTFKLYFPIASESLVPTAVPIDVRLVAGRGQAILLVEDQDAVRRFAREALRQHGYHVIEARNATDAIELVSDKVDTDRPPPHRRDHARNDRARTDCEQLLLVRPSLPVIFMSGYAGDAVARHGRAASGHEFPRETVFGHSIVADRRRAVARRDVIGTGRGAAAIRGRGTDARRSLGPEDRGLRGRCSVPRPG